MLRRIIVASALVVLVIAAVVVSLRSRGDDPIAARGGEPFTTQITAGHFRQADPRWGDDRIGGSGERLSHVGCTVSSLAMALATFDIAITPGELNARLASVDGYDARGRLRWATLQALMPAVRVDWSQPLSHATLDDALRRGWPVLVRVTLVSGVEHWVLVVGKDGLEYLVHDPAGDPTALVPLTRYGSPVLALRVVRPSV